MKSSPEGGFTSKKWIYGRGSIVGVLKPALLEEELQLGQDTLVVLSDEFGFTSKATFDSTTAMRKEPSPQKAKAELGKRRNPFSSSPDASPSKRTKDFSSGRDEYIPMDPRLEQELAGHETGSMLAAG
ncbi:hypothetical protein BGZ61DRAFT_485942 [Ilyonectria robusta]|uniref:uncharacterized protein n=1 Tax=Ilyonectria robusta TaxID=1079257 RepID=UPI001E8DDECC|nr:uncharacterized protein BGZ61DRAFT_485942 [Ilyonectria robusta]KAH8659512.1 hypothetical protein BGZ61DRAFT_485942 [Ilyonectria robusta]